MNHSIPTKIAVISGSILTLLALLLGRPEAFAASFFDLQTGQSSMASLSGGHYHPFRLEPYVQKFDVEIGHEGDASSVELHAIESDREGFYLERGGVRLRCRWVDASQRPLASVGDRVILAREQFRRGKNRRRLELGIRVEPGQVVAPGVYTKQVRIELLPDRKEKRGGGATIRSASIQVIVPEILEIGVGAPGTPFSEQPRGRLDFGELQRGKELRSAIKIRSNVSFGLFLESEHGGALKHEDPKFTETIPYRLEIAREAVFLQNGAARSLAPLRIPTGGFLSGKGVGSLAGLEIPFRVELRDLPSVPAGRYSDILTFTLSAE